MNRQKIFDDIKEALKKRSSRKKIYSEDQLDIKKAIKIVTPNSEAALLKQFKMELELVSGEFISANSVEQASGIIIGILKESNYHEFVISQEDVCNQIAERVAHRDKGIHFFSPSHLEYAKRKSRLAHIPVALVEATYAIADTGSLVFLYTKAGSLLPHFLSDCVISILDSSKIVPNQFELFASIPKEQAKDMVIVTGPSRTADIEKVLVLGAHGPRRLVVLHLNKSDLERNR